MENKYFLPGAVIVAGLFIAGAVVWSGSHPAVAPSGTTPNQAGTGAAPAVDIKNVKTDGNPFIGQANAPVTIAFWSDFQCPYCKALEVGGVPQIPTPAALPDIIKNYVDTGKVKIVFMDFTFLGNDSITAALYNRSVWKLYPAQYFAWRTAMYKAQDQEGDQGFGNAASIDKLDATIAGLDAAKITADMKANTATYQAMVDSDKAEAQKAGVNATPAFVIGKEVILGAYPYARFQAALDAVVK
jgi:protein-disulfide isomerase